jgi:hypothetical protein
MKQLTTRVLLLAAILFLMNACASQDGVVTESSATQSGAPVPGEKIPDQDTVVPGAGTNPNTGMRW